MPLPASGPISLNDVQTEFGGTTPIGITEYYGADTGVPISGQISLSDFYGKSSGWSSTITVGSVSFQYTYYTTPSGYRLKHTGYEYGYNNVPSSTFGSMSPTVFTDAGSNSRTVEGLYSYIAPAQGDTLTFALLGTSVPNTDTTFRAVDVNGNEFLRSAASYSTLSGYTYWTWHISSNPFPTSGTAPIRVKW